MDFDPKEADVKFCGIDLHSNNSVVIVSDEEDRIVFNKRLPNDLGQIRAALEPHREELAGVVIESTYNWYLLAEGYIYPREERGARDLARKRMQLVRYRTAQILAIENILIRQTGARMKGEAVKRLTTEQVDAFAFAPDVALAVEANRAVSQALGQQIEALERRLKERVSLRPEYRLLKTVPGIGQTLATTIMLETGAIGRFAQVGNFSSYCRCVDSLRESNGKKKGEGNTRNGNKYLAWAFVEAANFALR